MNNPLLLSSVNALELKLLKLKSGMLLAILLIGHQNQKEHLLITLKI